MRFFHTLVGSFYSVDTYREARRAPGSGLAYSFLLVALTTLVMLVYGLFLLHRVVFTTHYSPVSVFEQAVTQVAEQMPVMTLKDNHLKTRDAVPHTVTLDINAMGQNYHGSIATIDTTGRSTHENMKTPILITEKEAYFRNDSKGETTIRTLAELTQNENPTIVVNRAVAQGMGKQLIAFVEAHLIKFYTVLGLFLWMGLIMVFYVMRLCMLVTLALGGILISQCLRTKTSFDMSMRLAAVSFTPVVVISGIIQLVEARATPTMWLVICGLIMLTAAFAVTRDETLAESV